MTKTSTRSDTELSNLEKRVDDRFQAITNDVAEIKKNISDMATKFDEVMNAIHNLQTQKEPEKDSETSKNASKKDSETSKNASKKTTKSHDDNGDSGQGPTREDSTKSWVKKVELPTFEGDDPLGWITKAAKFFEIQKIEDDEEKLRLALICMEGEAIHWFQYWRDDVVDPDWDTLTEALLERFGDCAQGTIFERLSSIQQRGSVGEYIRDFELLLAQAKGTPDRIIMGYFLSGLRKPIRDQVRIQDPKRLVKALALARRIEEAQRDPRIPSNPPPRYRDSRYRGSGIQARSGSRDDQNGSRRTDTGLIGNHKPNSNSSTASTAGKPTGAKGQGRSAGTRFLSREEHARRWRENLCFSCGGHFSPGHRCPEGNLRVIILGDNEDIDDTGEIILLEQEEEDSNGSNDAEGKELNCIELSQFAAMGLTQPKTMKVIAIINGVVIVVLIDSGATHNFISRELASRLGLLVDKEGIYKVTLGDGKKQSTLGKCKGVKVSIGDYDTMVDTLVFELGGIDMVLGIS